MKPFFLILKAKYVQQQVFLVVYTHVYNHSIMPNVCNAPVGFSSSSEIKKLLFYFPADSK